MSTILPPCLLLTLRWIKLSMGNSTAMLNDRRISQHFSWLKHNELTNLINTEELCRQSAPWGREASQAFMPVLEIRGQSSNHQSETNYSFWSHIKSSSFPSFHLHIFASICHIWYLIKMCPTSNSPNSGHHVFILWMFFFLNAPWNIADIDTP